VEGSALLLEVANHGNRNLVLASRNLEGVELLSTAEVHPYHLLRYDRVIFSQPAIEKLQASLKSSASRRDHSSRAAEQGKPKKKVSRSRREKAAEVAQ
jgi:large subunit ribosomal protein L4